jgi:RNA polymerase sigma-70 factor (ECF subfamily)
MIPIGRSPDAAIMVKNAADVARRELTMAVLEHRSALMRFLMARGVPLDEAEDIIQDLFIKVECLSPGAVADPRAYIYRMAENLLLDRRRAAWRRGRREMAWTEFQLGPVMEADDRPSPERTLIARERLECVAKAMQSLPHKTVSIFRRFRVDGDLQREIAADMGISLSAVEKHLRKAYLAVSAVRAQLDDDAQSDLCQVPAAAASLSSAGDAVARP